MNAYYRELEVAQEITCWRVPGRFDDPGMRASRLRARFGGVVPRGCGLEHVSYLWIMSGLKWIGKLTLLLGDGVEVHLCEAAADSFSDGDFVGAGVAAEIKGGAHGTGWELFHAHGAAGSGKVVSALHEADAVAGCVGGVILVGAEVAHGHVTSLGNGTTASTDLGVIGVAREVRHVRVAVARHVASDEGSRRLWWHVGTAVAAVAWEAGENCRGWLHG